MASSAAAPSLALSRASTRLYRELRVILERHLERHPDAVEPARDLFVRGSKRRERVLMMSAVSGK